MTSYSLHVELDDITPSIWRRLRVPAAMPLPTLHLALQEAFGWEDRHLHSFGRDDAFGGRHLWQPNPEAFDSALPGMPAILDEAGATVAGLLPRVGSRATYEYDFGDSWQHTLTVLAVDEADDDAVHLLDGQRAGPPEDCGGVPGYMLLLETLTTLAADPDGVDGWERERVTLTFGHRAPQQILAELDHVDLDATGAQVAAVSAPVPAVRAELAEAMEQAQARGSRYLTRMVQLAHLDSADEPDEPDAGTCRAMIRPIEWLLHHVGTDGLALTSAGYLRPADVRALADELHLRNEWIGTLNRESSTPQITDFREAVQGLGLLRKAKGRLSLTAAAKRVLDDPVALWRYVARRLPVDKGEFPKIAGLLVMLDLAGQPVAAPDPERDHSGRWPIPESEEMRRIRAVAQQRLSDAVWSLGWRTDTGELSGDDVEYLADRTLTVLRRCGVVPAQGWDMRWQPTQPGLAFLRAALRA